MTDERTTTQPPAADVTGQAADSPRDGAPGPGPDPASEAPHVQAAPDATADPSAAVHEEALPDPHTDDAGDEEGDRDPPAVSADQIANLLDGEQPEEDDASDDECPAELDDGTPDEVWMSRMESIVFVYPEPISPRKLAAHLGLPTRRVRQLMQRLMDHYADRGIQLSLVGGGYQFHTHPDHADLIRSLTQTKPMRMSKAALETLAIVAYKQPCTRAEVEDVRRVDCGGTLKFLFEKGLIRVLGRKDEPGRPMIYGTTNRFLELFHLKSLADLPSLHEYTELWDEHQELVAEEEPAAEPDRVQQRIDVAADLLERHADGPRPDAATQEIPSDQQSGAPTIDREEEPS